MEHGAWGNELHGNPQAKNSLGQVGKQVAKCPLCLNSSQ